MPTVAKILEGVQHLLDSYAEEHRNSSAELKEARDDTEHSIYGVCSILVILKNIVLAMIQAKLESPEDLLIPPWPFLIWTVYFGFALISIIGIASIVCANARILSFICNFIRGRT